MAFGWQPAEMSALLGCSFTVYSDWLLFACFSLRQPSLHTTAIAQREVFSLGRDRCKVHFLVG